MEVQLPVSIEANLVRQMLVKKERRFIQVLCSLGEWLTPVSKPSSSFCLEKSPAVLSKAKTKAHVQGSCSSLECSALEPAGSC